MSGPTTPQLLYNPWLHIGAGLLAGNTPSTQPVNPWAGALSGMQNAAQFQNVLEQNKQRERLLKMNAARLAQQSKKEKDRQQNVENLIASLPPELKGLEAAIRANPGAFTGQMAQAVFPGTASRPSDIQEYEYAKNQGFKGTLQSWKLLSTQQRAAYFTAIPTAQGVMSFDTRTGTMRPAEVAGGQPQSQQPVLTPATDPALKQVMSAAETTGTKQAEARIDLPKVESNADRILTLVDEVIGHRGRSAGTGLSSLIDPRNYVPGTSAKDFQVALKQIKGKGFLQAYQELKGGGQITEIEGQKAEEAMARLDRAQSDEEFLNSMVDLKTEIVRLREVARARAGIQGASVVPAPAGNSVLRFDAQGNPLQ